MRWGIAGFGWVAREFMAPAIIEAGGVISAVADPSSTARSHAPRGARVFPTHEAMLADGGIDVVYVATPNHAHHAPVVAAAGARLAVLCEKPIAANLEDAESIAAAVSKAGVVYGTAFDQRYHPAHRAAADAIAHGEIGRPLAIRIIYACWVDPAWSPDGGAHDNWRADPAKAGGGAVIDLALHGLDLAQLLIGEPIETLHIALQRRVHDYPVDDGGMLTGRSADGVLFQSHVAYNCAEVLPRRRLEVLGETGMLVAIDTMGQTAGGHLARRCGKSGQEHTITFDQTSPFTAQAAAFMAAVRDKAHDFSLARDLASMRLFDRTYQEARQCL